MKKVTAAAISILGLYIAYRITKFYSTGYVEFKGDIEDIEKDPDMEVDIVDYMKQPLFGREIPKLAKKIALLARAALHPNKRTLDQVIQIKEWSSRYMKELNVRDVDAAHVLPFVERLAFLESKEERLARQMSVKEEYQVGLEETNTRLWSYQPPSLSHWFGRIISEPEVVEK